MGTCESAPEASLQAVVGVAQQSGAEAVLMLTEAAK